MADPVLSVGSYALGVVWIVVVGAAVAATWRSVARALDRPGGALGAVAGTVAALGQLTLTGQLLAAMGQLRAVPFAATMALEGAVARWWLRRGPEPRHVAVRQPEAMAGVPAERDRFSTVTAVAAVALVGVQWVTHTVDALDRGMTHPDTLWYHAPYSARFLQMGSLGDLGQLGYAQSRYFPLGSELLHAEAALPFHRDLLSPLVNLAFFALAVGAAWAIGARWGVGALAALGATTVLGLPTLAGTQPGQASNDVVVAALLLSAVALYVHADHHLPMSGLAGVALGLAVGSKVTVVAVAAMLTAAVLVRSIWAGHLRAGLGWVVGVALPVLCWPLRNAVIVGSPIPFFDVHVGPIEWDGVARPSGNPSLLGGLAQDTGWSYVGGLQIGFGWLWPVVLALLAATLVILARGPGVLRPAALAAIVGAAAYTITPYTGGSSFQFNLRYLTPALVLAAVLTAVASARWLTARVVVTGALVAVLLVNLFADHRERTEAWPSPPLVTLVGVVVVVGGIVVLTRFDHRRHLPAAALVVGAAVGAGWVLQQDYLERRYVEAGLHDDVLNADLQDTSGLDVEVLGTPEVYPFFGAELGNRVEDRSGQLFLHAPVPVDPCVHWRTELAGADTIVISGFGFVMRRFSAVERERIFEDDPAVTVLRSDEERAIYRLDGDLDPSACPPPGTG